MIQIPGVKIGATSLSRIINAAVSVRSHWHCLNVRKLFKWANIQRNERFIDDTITRNHL